MSDPDGLLDALAAELSDRGLIEHGDFYITGRGSGRPPSSEIVAMRFTEGNYRWGTATWGFPGRWWSRRTSRRPARSLCARHSDLPATVVVGCERTRWWIHPRC